MMDEKQIRQMIEDGTAELSKLYEPGRLHWTQDGHIGVRTLTGGVTWWVLTLCGVETDVAVEEEDRMSLKPCAVCMGRFQEMMVKVQRRLTFVLNGEYGSKPNALR